MPPDDEQDGRGAGGAAGRGRTGPRHAAPRKPLLTRFHVPAGKAIAIAAMPSAVLMGLGFTPQLAQAKPLPKNPFQDGPCVTAPDQKTDADGKDEKDAKDGKSKDDSKSKDGKGDDKAKGEQGKDKPKGEKTVTGTIGDVPSPSASGDKEAKDKSEGKTKDKDKDKPEDKSPSPSPHTATPSPSATHNPLDPLGLGDKIKDLLNGGHGKDEGKPAQPSTPTPTATPTTGGNSAADQKPAGEEPSPDKASGDAPSDQADKDDKKADEKDDKKADQKDPSATPSPDPTPTPTTTPDADGKKPYPCVVEKKSGGKDEQTPVGLPNQPWTLKSDLITMHNLQYHGVVNLRTADGRTKQALKFTMNSASIHNLDQTADQGVGGKRTYVRGGKGTTSTIDGGITMYTESLKGNLFGLLPVTFTPDFPPPITPPEIFFSDFTAIQAGQFGGTLRIPGLHSGME